MDVQAMLDAVARGAATARSEMRPEFMGKVFKGKVTSFDTAKGYGFIEIEPGSPHEMIFVLQGLQRVFFHITSLVPRPRTNADAHSNFHGKTVYFALGPNPRKRGRICAQNVSLHSSTSGSDDSSASNSVELRHAQDEHDDTSDSDISDFNPNEIMLPLDPYERRWKERFGQNNNTSAHKEAATPGRRNLTRMEQDLKDEAIKMGFVLPLIERALFAVDGVGQPKTYHTFSDLLEELLILQDSDNADIIGSFDNSEDFRLNSWIQQAEEMGFSSGTVLDALNSNTVPYEHFEDLIEKLMEMQVIKEQQRVAATNNQPVTEESKLTLLRKENQDLRDYFTCKICMEEDSAVVFIPCGHLCCCQGCANNQESCPVCRRKRSQIYFKKAAKMDERIGTRANNATLSSRTVEIGLLESENQYLRGNRACHTCKKRDRTQLYLPCLHVVSCGDCSKSSHFCPDCKASVLGRVQIYMA
ncbi:uncharacterized protein LOC129602013 [Paramacrobiotus metropolitanus]|uniref:uncharacterized protein LOC129602013 n=1 Tax=Paramacrobiotus metropolitanus TaxID=2943436 RepID=UPI0024460664|nr:uncharacterized protein LOC129602013 [Paramacrobiotus metropolitanus]